MGNKIKVWKCAKCSYTGTRKDVRKHLVEEEHINHKAKFYGRQVAHKGFRVHVEKGSFGEIKIKDERGITTQNMILVNEY
jgi:hypothetical protein